MSKSKEIKMDLYKAILSCVLCTVFYKEYFIRRHRKSVVNRVNEFNKLEYRNERMLAENVCNYLNYDVSCDEYHCPACSYQIDVESIKIDCYNCVNVPSKSDCHSLTVCSGLTPFCFITKSTGGNVTLGCANETSSQCVSYMTTLSTSTSWKTPTTPTVGYASSVSSATSPPVSTSTKIPTTTTTAYVTTPESATTDDITSEGTTVPAMPSIVGRSVRIEDPTRNEKTVCCDTGTCNGRLTPVFDDECLDEQESCQSLNNSFGICSKPTEAHKICKKTCNLCNYTDGVWSDWSSWSNCDATCGNGTQVRERACDSPPPQDGGLNCTGDSHEVQTCVQNDCPKDGNWNSWSSWSECSATCGVGLRRRDRVCNDPPPDPNGLYCMGDSRDDEICMANVTCGEGQVLAGQWESWSDWGPCSSTCGVGLKTRTRNCSEILCLGDSQQSDVCFGDHVFCAVRNWTEWSMWGECSVSCGVGMRYRERFCDNDTTLFAMPCVGDSREFELCHQHICTDQESAFFANGQPTDGITNGTIAFPDAITNMGGDYDNVTGIFTCRISGLYSFFVSIEKQADVAQAYCHLLLNESSVFTVRVQSSSFGGIGTLQQATNSAVLELSKGDTVQLGVCSKPATMTKFCTFSGNIISLN